MRREEQVGTYIRRSCSSASWREPKRPRRGFACWCCTNRDITDQHPVPNRYIIFSDERHDDSLEVQSQSRVLLDQSPGSLLDGLGPDTTLSSSESEALETTVDARPTRWREMEARGSRWRDAFEIEREVQGGRYVRVHVRCGKGACASFRSGFRQIPGSVMVQLQREWLVR